jgi:hypothetical protein
MKLKAATGISPIPATPAVMGGFTCHAGDIPWICKKK